MNTITVFRPKTPWAIALRLWTRDQTAAMRRPMAWAAVTAVALGLLAFFGVGQDCGGRGQADPGRPIALADSDDLADLPQAAGHSKPGQSDVPVGNWQHLAAQRRQRGRTALCIVLGVMALLAVAAKCSPLGRA